VLHLEESRQQFGNRTRVEILGSILKVASSGTLKTHIMYRANLSHRQLEKYLKFLEEKGLLMEFVDEETGTNLFKITEKGIEFLKEYAHLSNYLGPTTP
jgi:predicted transcriptional regulator